MTKSIITITDDGKQIKVEVVHDPLPTGGRETWHIPAQVADMMCKYLMSRGTEAGIDPVYEAYRNFKTGHVNVTTRTKEPKEPNERAGTDS